MKSVSRTAVARMEHPAAASRPPDRQPLLAAAVLASGAALVVSIFSGVSLAITLGLLVAAAGLSVAVKWSGTAARARPKVRAQLRVGLAAGLAATVAYDLSRFLLVHLGRMEFFPFESFTVFGTLIIGTGAPAAAALVVGTAYHLLNGIAFGVSYCLLLGGRRWTFGVLWAFGLEAAMVTIYPGWLDLDAVMAEFLTVSAIGHFAYGATLGLISERWLRGMAARRTAAP